MYRLHTKGEVAKSLGNQAQGMQLACTMTTQNSKIRLISSIALKSRLIDNLVINLLLANLIGQFKPVIIQTYNYINNSYIPPHWTPATPADPHSYWPTPL